MPSPSQSIANHLTPAQQQIADAMSEAELQDAIIELAHRRGWLVAHFRPAKTDKGWRTPVGADGKGFPDLILIHKAKRKMVTAEVKREDGKLTPEQAVWYEHCCSVAAPSNGWLRVFIWRPSDWLSGEIEKALE